MPRKGPSACRLEREVRKPKDTAAGALKSVAIGLPGLAFFERPPPPSICFEGRKTRDRGAP